MYVPVCDWGKCNVSLRVSPEAKHEARRQSFYSAQIRLGNEVKGPLMTPFRVSEGREGVAWGGGGTDPAQ